MFGNLIEKLKESAISVLPISAIVFLLHFTVAPLPLGTLALFITGTFFLILGMGIFMLGADMAMVPMGEIIGSKLVESRKLWWMVLGCFVLGFVMTVAEPDLQILTRQVPSVPNWVMISSVSFGVGVFLVLALLRVLYQIKLAYLFIGMYALIFILAAFTTSDYFALAFDSSGVTTGSITVPFILAMGLGVSAVRSGKSAEEDSFGLCALSSIGPIITVLIMGLFYDSSGNAYALEPVHTVSSFPELITRYISGMTSILLEIGIALLPIVVIFGSYQFARLKLPKSQIIRIVVGIVYTLLGLTVFIAGVNIGFMPTGNYLGQKMASLSYNWIIIPMSVLMGFFVVAAEPAVHVLNKQVEELTNRAISRKMMMVGISVGVSIALALSMVRIMTQISIWYFILPGYAIALILTFFVPNIFTAIAFDSGGIASGTMTAAFLLPFAVGATNQLGGNAMADAFGIIAIVGMMPLITMQLIGLVYSIKLRRADKAVADGDLSEVDSDTSIIEF